MRWIFMCSVIMLFSCTPANKLTISFADNPVIAHRGAWKKKGLPENSIAALKEAIRLGCTGSEFDIWMTTDDSLVVNHDPQYHKLPIETSTYNELLPFLLTNGEKIPTLREYLVAGMQHNRSTRLVLEIKPSTISQERGRRVAEKVVALVEELSAENMSVYISFDYNILLRIIQLDPSALTQYLKGDLPPSVLKKDKLAGLDYHFSIFKKNPGWIDAAKKDKLELNAWTVNEEKEMRNLLDSGFHFITTNEPELLMQVWRTNRRVGS